MQLQKTLCHGHRPIPEYWYNGAPTITNRLYYFEDKGAVGNINGRKFEFQPHVLYFIPVKATFEPIGSISKGIIHYFCDFELFPPVLSCDVLSVTRNDLNDVEKDCLDLFLKILERYDNEGVPRKEWDDMISAITVTLCNAVFNKYNTVTLQDQISLFAIEAMHTRPLGTVNIEGLAAECFMSPNSFIRHFSKIIGMTPYTYYKALRTRRAEALIESGVPLNSVAEEVGYADSSALLHALKKPKSRKD